jgi:DNA mismatch endonuclease (patch repair protein)
MMRGIRGKDTKPEWIVRQGLYAKGFRYRLHCSDLPGAPDLVFRKHRAVIFVHGCFWHKHDCHLFKWPTSRAEFWREKIGSNATRDLRIAKSLRASDWRVLTIWECALKGRKRKAVPDLMDEIAAWLKSSSEECTIQGGD